MWLRPQGYAEIISPDSAQANLDGFQAEEVRVGTNRYDTMTCGHCGKVTHVKAKIKPEDIGGLCKICMKLICKNCLDKGCTPLEKRMEEIETKIRNNLERERYIRLYGI